MADKYSIIGAGAWGTAVAVHLASSPAFVMMWANEKEIVQSVNTDNRNRFLEGFTLSPQITATDCIQTALQFSDVVFWAVPVQFLSSVIENVDNISIVGDKVFVNLSKGIDIKTLKSPLQILHDKFGNNVHYIALSGPSFADELAMGKPTILVSAGKDLGYAKKIQKIMQHRSVRVYTSDDPHGIQIAGAFKNIYAIASGICDGMDLGDNARAALITRAIVEMTRLAARLDVSPSIISGAAGIGDLILTCTSEKSRNYRLGVEIGKGRKAKDVVDEMEKAVEGYFSSKAAYFLAEKIGVELPIAKIIYTILYEDKSPTKALKELMSRSPKPEWY